jgi:hypothetical protein
MRLIAALFAIDRARPSCLKDRASNPRCYSATRVRKSNFFVTVRMHGLLALVRLAT